MVYSFDELQTEKKENMKVAFLQGAHFTHIELACLKRMGFQ